MKQYKFSALIMFEPAARETAARGQLGGMHACRLLQPRHGMYFPAVISAEEELTARAAVHGGGVPQARISCSPERVPGSPAGTATRGPARIDSPLIIRPSRT